MKEEERNELVKYRLNRAKDTLREVEFILNGELYNTAVNRIYYACYYAVVALLLQNNINAQSHSGVRHMFGLHFVKDKKIDNSLGRFFSDIFDKRQTSDYGDFVYFEKDEVKNLLKSAKEFVKEISVLIKSY